MKKLLIISAAALCVLASSSAQAEVSVAIGVPLFAPAPVYYPPPVYDPGYVDYYHRYPSQYYDRRYHHRHDDWAYWNHRRDHDHR